MIEHGWLELDGEIIDPTLVADPVEYFAGLRFSERETWQLAGKLGGFPLFYGYGWGGWDSLEFRAAREAAEAFAAEINGKPVSA